MIALPFAKGKTYGVMGLGMSGRAVAASLLSSGAEVVAWDSNANTVAALQKDFAAAQYKPESEWDWKKLAGLVMSPGIPLYHPQRHPAVALAEQHGVELLGDIELLYRAQPDAQYIGITGTNGKSTTTALIGHVLNACGKRAEVGGNIGTPVLDLPRLGKDGIYVLELSSYQLELVRSTKFTTGVLLNISPDHLDHHGSMESYITAKRHLFDRQTKRDVAVIGVDDAESDAIAKALLAGRQQSVIPISAKRKLGSGIYVQEGLLRNAFALQEEEGDLRGIASLRGEHNWQNAAAAYAACFAVGCRHEDIMAAMRTFPGLPHRMQWLGEIKGIRFVNDSKATNADAAEKALKSYDEIYWIAGGVAKEGGIAPLAPYFPKIRHAYLIGEAANDFARTLEGKVPFTQCGTLDKAFDAATGAAMKAGRGTLLLAPACASFDQFPNFEKRGEAFVALVERWRNRA